MPRAAQSDQGFYYCAPRAASPIASIYRMGGTEKGPRGAVAAGKGVGRHWNVPYDDTSSHRW